MIHSLLRRTLPPRLYTRLGLAREALGRARFRPYVATHRYGRRDLSVRIADEMGRSWYDHAWTTPAEIDLLAERGRLREGVRVFEVGAHQGLVAMMLADIVGERGQVVALEATPHNAELAVANAARNGLAQIEVLHAAGAEVPGVLHFSPRMNGHVAASDEASVAVRAVTVDELTAAFGPPQVLFVDVEGYELHVLRGARATLDTHRPDLFVEVHMGEGLERFGNADDLLALLPPAYEILVSRTEHGPYRPLADARGELRRHSRLVALAGATAPST
ncbi:MAG TPA: FkbM family methyltransferase [Gemmatimonadaceae bacterium]|jgi:FkbM family methyltransferase|nr:FkbM family methyltransferase [Gemmatimonadaceae bacterium]